MKNKWYVFIFLTGVFFVVILALNYSKNKSSVPLSQIFSEQTPVDVEYEFVNAETEEGLSASHQMNKDVIAKEIKVVENNIPVNSIPKQETDQKIEEKPKTSVKSSSPSNEPKKGSYSIQVASFKDKTKADKFLNELIKSGYADSYTSSRDLGEKGVWYRVYIGNFDSKGAADTFLINVKSKYPGSLVIKR